jgi:hypothetical protein
MTGPALRLGDLVDDYCPRCRLLLNHAVASLVDGQVVKVICQTCYSEHAYQRGRSERKKGGPRATLFDQVLAKVSSGPPASAPPTPKKKAAPLEPPGAKKVAPPARYISRHKIKPPRRGP